MFKNKANGATWTLGIPDHTAIVEKASGTKVTLLHQDVDGKPAKDKSHVRRLELDLKWKTRGDYLFYHPQPE